MTLLANLLLLLTPIFVALTTSFHASSATAYAITTGNSARTGIPSKKPSYAPTSSPPTPSPTPNTGTTSDFYYQGIRLPDWSKAGYNSQPGRVVFPSYSNIFDASKYSIGPDTSSDQTDKIQKLVLIAEESATSMSNGSVVYFPAGTYKISNRIIIRTSFVIIRGAGRGKTIFSISNDLSSIDKRYNSMYDDEGFFQIGTSKRDQVVLVGDITGKPIAENSRVLTGMTFTSAGITGLKRGDVVKLIMGNKENNDLADTIFSDKAYELCAAKPNNCFDLLKNNNELVQFGAIVVSVDRDRNQVYLDREMPFAVKQLWSPRLFKINLLRSVQHSGMEDFTILFDWSYNLLTNTAKSRRGINGVWITQTTNCWLSGVEVINSDIGITVDYSAFITLKNVSTGLTKPRSQPKVLAPGDSDTYYWFDGEVGIALNEGTSHSVVENFYVQGVVDLGIRMKNAICCVFKNGVGTDLKIDLHRRMPFANLWSNIDVGRGGVQGSTGIRGIVFGTHGESPKSGFPAAWTTFWNIYYSETDRYGMPLPQNALKVTIGRDTMQGDCTYGTRLLWVGYYDPGGPVSRPVCDTCNLFVIKKPIPADFHQLQISDVVSGPTVSPTFASMPINSPSISYTSSLPTILPSTSQSINPTLSPSVSFTSYIPSISLSAIPSASPSFLPTKATPSSTTPSTSPSILPTIVTPSAEPTSPKPTFRPTASPTTRKPTAMPTRKRTIAPTRKK